MDNTLIEDGPDPLDPKKPRPLDQAWLADFRRAQLDAIGAEPLDFRPRLVTARFGAAIPVHSGDEPPADARVVSFEMPALDLFGFHSARKSQARTLLDGAVARARQSGEAHLPGFGTFKPARRPGRVGVNPKTGEKMKLLARERIEFAPARELQQAARGGSIVPTDSPIVRRILSVAARETRDLALTPDLVLYKVALRARSGVNPATGARILIPAHTKVELLIRDE